jgi:hypothetical protein
MYNIQNDFKKRVKLIISGSSECGRFYTPARERTRKWEISGISRRLCGRLPHKMGGLAGMGNCKMHRFDLWVLEFMISNITGNNQRGNCITLDFNFRGLSEPRNQQKLEPHD